MGAADALLNERRANPVCNLKTLSGNLFDHNADPAQHRSAPSPTPAGPFPGGPQFFRGGGPRTECKSRQLAETHVTSSQSATPYLKCDTLSGLVTTRLPLGVQEGKN